MSKFVFSESVFSEYGRSLGLLTFGGRSSGGVRGSSSSSAAKNHPMRVMLTRSRHIPHIAFTAC
ncbi:MAG: hypothetical protein RBR40_13460, partial [Tenuifilaceae bacterium]|nr:hypothetical protein [Tenuifilaceae bacterium]